MIWEVVETNNSGRSKAEIVSLPAASVADLAAWVFGKLAVSEQDGLRFVFASPASDIHAKILDDATFRLWKGEQSKLALDQIVLRAMHDAGLAG